MELGSDNNNLDRRPVNFRSPYSSVAYDYLGPDNRSITLLVDQPMTVTMVTIAHVINTPGPLTLTLDDQDYTARPVN